MTNTELTPAGKAGLGGACAVCCAAPMLVLTGVLSFGTAALAGIMIGAVLAIALLGYGVVTGRVGSTPVSARLGLTILGAVAAGVGALDPSGSSSRSAFTAAIGLLASAALLALADARGHLAR